jgi:hypothetical protein
MTRFVAISAVLTLSLWLTGCSGGPRPADQSDPAAAQKAGELEEIYNLLALYVEQTGRSPTSVKELASLENAYPAGFEQIRSAHVVVVWGGKPDKNATAVLAYEKNTPTEGGWVLLANGTIKQMTTDEFKATPKAK